MMSAQRTIYGAGRGLLAVAAMALILWSGKGLLNRQNSVSDQAAVTRNNDSQMSEKSAETSVAPLDSASTRGQPGATETEQTTTDTGRQAEDEGQTVATAESQLRRALTENINARWDNQGNLTSVIAKVGGRKGIDCEVISAEFTVKNMGDNQVPTVRLKIIGPNGEPIWQRLRLENGRLLGDNTQSGLPGDYIIPPG